MPIDTFLTRWRNSGGSERANYQLFIPDLCEMLQVDRPQPPNEDTRDNPYVFKRRVVFHHGDGSTSNEFVDCYKRHAFIGELKKIRAGAESPAPLDEADIAQRFTGKGPWKKRMAQILETPVTLGRALISDDGRFGASR